MIFFNLLYLCNNKSEGAVRNGAESEIHLYRTSGVSGRTIRALQAMLR